MGVSLQGFGTARMILEIDGATAMSNQAGDIAGAEALIDRIRPGGPRWLLAGLGLGYSLARLLAVGEADLAVTVVEQRAEVPAHAETVHPGLLADPRVTLVLADLAGYVPEAAFDRLALDIDNGPGMLLGPDNAPWYTPAGVAQLAGWLAPGGRLTLWARPVDTGLTAVLETALTAVASARAGTGLILWGDR